MLFPNIQKRSAGIRTVAYKKDKKEFKTIRHVVQYEIIQEEIDSPIYKEELNWQALEM